MKNKIFLICIYIVLISAAYGENKINNEPNVHPLELEFQRLAVRHFIFSNNINLNEFIPSEIVAFPSMHPAFSINNTDKALLDTAFISQIEKGQLILNGDSDSQEAHIYMGGVNPYATYDMSAENVKHGEAGIEITRHGNLHVHTYPDLKELVELNLPLQPH